MSSSGAPVRTLSSPEAIGEELAAHILARIERARGANRPFLLGCPTGRTPRPVFAAMARQVAARPQDLSHLVLVMMDEYLVRNGERLLYASAEAPWSCHHFARVEIAEPLNAKLREAQRLGDGSIWFPEPDAPEAYESRITSAGGIDFFLLASGASDGHVAFNPPGSALTSRTRVIPLSDDTRRDNLQTFPAFGSLDAVPHHGISVGVATITAAREAAMVVWGAGKRLTLQRMRATDRYDPSWPATLIHECANRQIIADAAASAT